MEQNEDKYLKLISCKYCQTVSQIMKRCTRCRNVMYCSRTCQEKDWKCHRTFCSKSRNIPSPFISHADKSIFEENDDDKTTGLHERKTNQTLKPAEIEKRTVYYLNWNSKQYDIPVINNEQEAISVTLRANKEKIKIDISTEWSNQDILKYISFKTQIPLNSLKVIHKGRILDCETIGSVVKKGAMFQVLGEKAEDDNDVDEKDIKIIMQQLCIDRNSAVKALKQHGSLIDAIMSVANK